MTRTSRLLALCTALLATLILVDATTAPADNAMMSINAASIRA